MTACLGVDAQRSSSGLQWLHEAWAKREIGVRMRWQFTHHRYSRLTPQQQVEVKQREYQMAVERARQELSQQGAPPSTVQKQAQEFASAFVASGSLHEYTFRGEVDLWRGKDKLFVRAPEPALSAHGVERMQWEVLYDTDVVIAAPQNWSLAGMQYTSARFREAERMGIGTPWVKVWKSHSPAYSYRLSRFPLFLTPELLVWLGSVSPEKMYGGQWTLEHETLDAWILRQRVTEGELAPFIVRIAFPKSRGGIPSWAEVVHELGRYRETYRVTSWKLYGDVWLAATVVAVRITDLFEDRRTWQLRRVEPTEASPPRSPNIPIGMPVADYRLVGPAADLFGAGGARNKLVGYEWQGFLPGERELRQKLREGEVRTKPSSGAVRWRLLPPLLLVIIGILWYWRLRRGEGKK
ncbi:MAG: hypothetical protein ACP5RN_14910 [Armatimonadota bacterium]